MDSTRIRIAALFFLAAAAGSFGYGFGWQCGHMAGSADADRQLRITTQRLYDAMSVRDQTSDAEPHETLPGGI
jgi:hypothetical protein